MKRSDITYPDNFMPFIMQVAEDNLPEAFCRQETIIKGFLGSISEEDAYLIYTPGTWTVKEVLQHIIDTERVLCHRALSFARGEDQPLP
ncbi:MAG: DinB family protein, partial [Bacteroidetes bacterium]|nr:DinB family protein [Bacteroidota bacterium]